MILGVTTFLKLLLAKFVLAEFFNGAFFGLNYSVRFVLVQLCGFSIATKQPATTAVDFILPLNEIAAMLVELVGSGKG